MAVAHVQCQSVNRRCRLKENGGSGIKVGSVCHRGCGAAHGPSGHFRPMGCSKQRQARTRVNSVYWRKKN